MAGDRTPNISTTARCRRGRSTRNGCHSTDPAAGRTTLPVSARPRRTKPPPAPPVRPSTSTERGQQRRPLAIHARVRIAGKQSSSSAMQDRSGHRTFQPLQVAATPAAPTGGHGLTTGRRPRRLQRLPDGLNEPQQHASGSITAARPERPLTTQACGRDPSTRSVVALLRHRHMGDIP